MRTAIAFVLSALLLGCIGPRTATPLRVAPSAATEEGTQSVLLVISSASDEVGYHGRGSAFPVIYRGEDGIMTAWHVVEERRTITVTGAGVTRTVGPFTKVGEDVAFFKCPLPSSWTPIPAYPVFANQSWGNCIAWGYPYDEGRMVGHRCKDSGLMRWIMSPWGRRMDGKAVPGMSGGPVINDDPKSPMYGCALGVVSTTELPLKMSHYPARIP